MFKILFLLLILILVMTFGLECHAEEMTEFEGETMTDTLEEIVAEVPVQSSWEIYIREELIPLLLHALVFAVIVYVMLLPIMRYMKKRADEFKNGTEGIVNTTTLAEESKEKLQKTEESLKKTVSKMQTELSAYRKEMSRIRKILRMAFGNSDELVRKGVARKIIKLDTEEGEEKEKNYEDTEG